MKTAVFDIRDHLDRLNVIKETSTEYHCSCPVCNEGGFKIEKKSGKYNAFKCHCDTREIREAIRPWEEVQEDMEKGGQGEGEYLSSLIPESPSPRVPKTLGGGQV